MKKLELQVGTVYVEADEVNPLRCGSCRFLTRQNNALQCLLYEELIDNYQRCENCQFDTIAN